MDSKHTSEKSTHHGKHMGKNQNIEKSQEHHKQFSGDLNPEKVDVIDQSSMSSMDCSDPPSTY
jgi:hypothetical protein